MKYNNYMIGEKEPFLETTKIGLQRLAEALIRTGSKLQGSYVFDPKHPRSSFVASVSVPDGREQQFEILCKCTLTKHPAIQVGMQVIEPIHSFESA